MPTQQGSRPSLPLARNRGFTLVELLVVIAIISLLAAMLFPVLARARDKARQAACQSNLKQIGVALAMYRTDHDDVNCPCRQCPVPDPEPTGFYPPDTWWAPYDPSVPPNAPPGPNWQPGLLFPYVGSVALFKCPAAPEWQCSYAMSYVSGSPHADARLYPVIAGMPDALVSSPAERLAVWDHCRTPGCAGAAGPGDGGHPPFVPFAGDPESELHYPLRHHGGANFLYHDGHVKWLRPTSLRVGLFREPGSAPPVPGYPGQ